MQCKICDQEVGALHALALHIRKKHTEITTEEYYQKFLMKDDEVTHCVICGKKLKFKTFSVGYQAITCGRKCGHNLRVQRNIDAYGVENISQLQSVKDKKRELSIERYGVSCTMNDSAVRAKREKTWLSKYGVSHPLKNNTVKERVRKTIDEKYGSRKGLSIIAKIKQKETSLRKYWPIYIDKLKKWKHIEPMFTVDEYTSPENGDYNFKCLRCGNISTFNKYDSRSLRAVSVYCKSCVNSRSSYEHDLERYLYDHGITNVEKNKSFSHNGVWKELDLYIPDFNIGIEIDGIYWHSDKYKSDTYHIDKTEWFNANFNIDIIHIFEDEIINSCDIVMSIIMNKLAMPNNRVFARKTKLVELQPIEYKAFLEENHIQGECNSKLRRGLSYNGEIIAVAGFGMSRFKQGEYELHRFCPKIGYSIPGGLSKLTSGIDKDVVSYCDRRLFNASGYISSGFEVVGTTKPSYFYVKGRSRYNRINFQKHKLESILPIYNPDKTERENMSDNGYMRIYDCGNIKLIKRQGHE